MQSVSRVRTRILSSKRGHFADLEQSSVCPGILTEELQLCIVGWLADGVEKAEYEPVGLVPGPGHSIMLVLKHRYSTVSQGCIQDFFWWGGVSCISSGKKNRTEI